MVRPQKYPDLDQAAAAKARQDRQRYLARGARKIKEQVPSFVPYMPLPGSIPPTTPAELNLRVDVPQVIALSPNGAAAKEVRFHGPELALPYRLSTPLPLPLSALSQTNEHDDEFEVNDGFEVNDDGERYWTEDADGFWVNDDGDHILTEGDDVNWQEVGQALWPTHTAASSRSDTPAPAPRIQTPAPAPAPETTDMRTSSRSETPAPSPQTTDIPASSRSHIAHDDTYDLRDTHCITAAPQTQTPLSAPQIQMPATAPAPRTTDMLASSRSETPALSRRVTLLGIKLEFSRLMPRRVS